MTAAAGEPAAGFAGRPAVAGTRAELAAALAPCRDTSGRVALVATMGALHEGHADLIRRARGRLAPSDLVVVSIFVNPLQFAPGEDLARYPRPWRSDLALCAAEKADVVFAPSVDQMYPDGEPSVSVAPGPLGRVLEGSSRPTHFRGVLTVVAKLFGLVRPDLAVFGEKDYQQLVLVRRMVADLCFGTEVVGAPIVREPDGLAVSSRNRYLDAEQRAVSPALSRALAAGAETAAYGADRVLAAARALLDEADGLVVDYLALTSPELGPAPATGPARLLVAARLGDTRLIDNTPLLLGGRRRIGKPGGS